MRPLETNMELPELLLASTQTLTMTVLLGAWEWLHLDIALDKTKLNGNVTYGQGEGLG